MVRRERRSERNVEIADGSAGRAELLETFGGVLDHWREKRGASALPSRADMDPVAMPRHAITRLALFDLVAGPDFRCRLIGEAVIAALGRNPKGELLHAGHPDEAAWRALGATFHRCVERRAVVLVAGTVDRRLLRVLALPLAADGATPDAVLACFEFDPAPSDVESWMRGPYAEIGRREPG